MALETTRKGSPAKRPRSGSSSHTSDLDTPRKKARSLARKPDDSMVDKETAECSTAATGVCALTNARVELHQTYLVPKEASSDLIDDLEISWGMDPATLNLEDESNLLTLSPEARESFEAGHWALLPCDLTVPTRMYQYSKGEENEQIKRITDIYKAEEMDEFPFQIIPLSRFNTPVYRRAEPNSCSPVKYTFQKLPEVTLRVHPHLVAFNLVTKYLRLTEEERQVLRSWLRKNMSEVVTDIDFFKNMYSRWVPTKEFAHEYVHLPPFDRRLNCLVRPNDSISILSVDSGSNSGYEPEDFSEPDTILRNRISSWAEAVAEALDEDPTEPPMPTSYPLSPSTFPSPTAPSTDQAPPAKGAT